MWLLLGKIKLLLVLTAIAWFIHFINSMFVYRDRKHGLSRHPLNQAFGIYPRTFRGLPGIFAVHFLHSSWDHLKGNTSVFLPLGFFILLQGLHLFYVVTLCIALIGGVLTWLIDKKSEYDIPGVGASILIYGYMSFLGIYGIVADDYAASILAILAWLLHGTMITGKYHRDGKLMVGWLPLNEYSGGGRYGHLSGVVAGGITAYLLGFIKTSNL